MTGELGPVVSQEGWCTPCWRAGILAEPLSCPRCREMVAEQVGVEPEPARERLRVEEVSNEGQAAGVVLQQDFRHREVWQAGGSAHARAGDLDGLLECLDGEFPLP